jgi:hypothetical protein
MLLINQKIVLGHGHSVTFLGKWMMYKTSILPLNVQQISYVIYAESIEITCFSNGSIYGHFGLKNFSLIDMGKGTLGNHLNISTVKISMTYNLNHATS